MKILVIVLLLFVVVVPCVSQSDKVDLTIVTSPDVTTMLSRNRLAGCLKRLARESKVELKQLPHIVVFQVSKSAARGAFVTKDVAVRLNRATPTGQEYYEVWLVGDPKLNYVVALENVLEDHFQLKISDQERAEVLTRVARVEDATLSVAEGK